MTMPRALLLACSQRKTPAAGVLPAIDRYDGPAFRVLRRYLRATQDRDLIVYVLSAEFGLIPSERLIPSYDRRMTDERASELAPAVARELRSALQTTTPAELFISVGNNYAPALAAWQPGSIDVHFAAPGPGRKLRSLKRWLYGGEARGSR